MNEFPLLTILLWSTLIQYCWVSVMLMKQFNIKTDILQSQYKFCLNCCLSNVHHQLWYEGGNCVVTPGWPRLDYVHSGCHSAGWQLLIIYNHSKSMSWGNQIPLLEIWNGQQKRAGVVEAAMKCHETEQERSCQASCHVQANHWCKL